MIEPQPTVAVEGFSGPFDLLLRLVERRELNLLTISLAAVAEQYLDQLEQANLRDPEHLSAFLIVAAKLLLIKSTLVLPSSPRPSPDEPAADPTDLVERLRVYQQYRNGANFLAGRDEAGARSYPRPPMPYQLPPRPPAALEPPLLRNAFLAATRRPKPVPAQSMPVEQRVSVAEVVASLRALLQAQKSVALSDLVAASASPQRHVAAFLAILEIVRLGLASASQEQRFGEIQLLARTDATD